ncbi:MerR family transcriptional regulator [Pseudonocardia sp. T1-2H]|uniref:MerR family transcriptional regulator n=1 Tax=Pseudonocardia sp. T1-2H TaxID=3128899 RepID=UPI003101A489
MAGDVHPADSTPPLPSSAGLPISEVAARTGLTVTTLRMWQARYGLGPTHRSAGGHRRYTWADLERLQAVRRLVDQGIPTAAAARTVLAASPQTLGLPPEVDPVAHRLGAAALDLDGPAVRRLLADHLACTSVEATWENVLRPVLSAIGGRWADLAHGIAVEHLISHIATVELTRAVQPVDPAGSTGPAVLLACAPEEQHELPLVAAAAALDAAGIVSTLLGARTPAPTLRDTATRAARAVLAVLALTPDVTDPSVFDSIRCPADLVAAGPGWTSAGLAPPVVLVDGLAATVETLTRLHAARDSGSMA